MGKAVKFEKPEARRETPLAVKLQCALDQLEAAYRKLGRIPEGTGPVSWDFDHIPALALRRHDPDTGHHIPHQHSPKHLAWLPRAEHKQKTSGRRGESKLSIRDGDQGKIAKIKRMDKKKAARQEAKEIPPGGKSKGKPKAKIPSRPKEARKPQKRASGYVRKGV